MKKITQLLLFIAFACVTYGQQITLIDFGLPAQTTSGNWNNVTDSETEGSFINLVDDSGILTGEVITLTDDFDDEINGGGTLTPDSGLPFPVSASRDNFFGEDVDFTDGAGGSSVSNEPTGGFTLSQLEVGKYYSFQIFASRAGVADNRETLYTITGDGGAQTATLEASNNTDNVATILNIQPNVSGEITIQVEKGPNNDNSFGFYYIGAIEMTKTDATLSNKRFGINGTVSVYPNPSSESQFVKINLNLNAAARIKMDVYDITGKLIKTLLNEEKSAGAFVQTWDRSQVASGLYVLKIDADGKKQNSKLILK